ncbi:cell wall hydrolase [Hansschlegelia zhihuaiae]|uniref:Cell wall hydrolase n=1 Tax=Hansschlegelia zhihuaiae TaxID=405005 RepID=A0A4Q0M7S3_9HYPH|nr:cell wall hydrolase [Hansschlegelia zhihuaiae]
MVLLVASAALAGCASKGSVTRVRLSERECLARAMYFESNRSSDAGMLAVGTVVMNRLKSGKYGSTICEVVGAPRQFAPGVLTRSMNDRGAPRARKVADAVLAGRRHRGVQNAEFFHTAGYKFPYRNMRYVLVAGGNAFYDKRQPPKTWWGGEGRWGPPPTPTERIDGGEVMVASVEVEDDAARPAAPKRAFEAQPAPVETKVAVAEAPRARSGFSGGIPIFEPPPSDRALSARRPAPTVVASLDRPVPANRAEARASLREDNGLREEDRWRDQELAEESGRKPASDGDWRERRDPTIESAPLPVIETAPEPRPARPSRVARAPESYGGGYDAPEPKPVRSAPVAARAPESYGDGYDAPEPKPSRNVQVASRASRTVDVRSRPVEADPAALGWRTGPQPVRTESSGDAGGYQPLSQAASEGSGANDRRAPSRSKSRSYGGVELGDVGFGYR